MTDTQGQPADTAAAVPTPTPEQGNLSTTQPNQPAQDNTAQAVDFDRVDRDAYAALREEMLSKPETEQPGQPAAEIPATDTPPAGDDAPANETIETDDGRVPDRIRLGGLSEADRALTSAAVLAAKAQGISVAEAMMRLTGGTPPAKTETTQPPTEAAPAAASPDAIRAEIARMRAERKQAGEDADTVRMGELSDAIDDARDSLTAAEAAQAQAGAKAVSDIQSSKARAATLYPQFKDPASPLSQRWTEVYERLQANADPLLAGHNPNLPLIISQMAAAELGIAPASSVPAVKAAPSTQSPSAPAARPVQLVPGSARSMAPSNPNGQLDSRLAGVTTTGDYEQLKEELFAARR